MFDAGFWELLLISVIALIVVGPDKIPKLAKSVGKFIGKIKSFARETQESMQQEFNKDNLKEQFGFTESDSILEIVKDTENKIKQQFDTRHIEVKELEDTSQESTTQTKET